MMIIGTSHFVRHRCALSYYAEYGIGRAGVKRAGSELSGAIGRLPAAEAYIASFSQPAQRSPRPPR